MPSAVIFDSIFFHVIECQFSSTAPTFSCDYDHRMLCETHAILSPIGRLRGRPMEKSTLQSGIQKLALIGEQVGFTVEEMIELLNAGLGVETLLDLISWRLEQCAPLSPIIRSSRWTA